MGRINAPLNIGSPMQLLVQIRHRLGGSTLLFIVLLISGCTQATAVANPNLSGEVVTEPAAPPTAEPTATLVATPLPSATVTTAVSAAPVASPTVTPFYTGPAPTACGVLLPLVKDANIKTTDRLSPPADALAELREIVPEAAWPALEQLLAAPETVGLAAYRVGAAGEGAFLNAETPMPLASVVKVIHLVAYADAVAAGELNPLATVALADLESYYLPRSDLGTHEEALRELEADGRLFGNPPALVLDAIPWMMIRHSSNAATDYLHDLLGQRRIEETALRLELSSQTAPCPFLGQFLAMGNHTRAATDDRQAIRNYLNAPASYGEDVALLTAAYSSDVTFRAAERAWRATTRRPRVSSQRYFSDSLNAAASALDYAGLMSRLALNGLSSGESSYTARRHLEWPMQFPTNQELFSNLGYKNGALPGILTTVYYAYPLGETTPVVVALFYRDLPGGSYQQWRRELPHDELARWLLSDPAAIPAIRAVLSP